MNQRPGHRSGGDASGAFLRLLKRELFRARREHWRAALPFALTAAALLVSLFALWLHFSPPATPAAGAALAFAAWACLLLPFLLAFLWPLRRLPGLRRLLAEAEERAHTRQLLETATDIAQGKLTGKGYSSELMDGLLVHAASSAAQGLPPAPDSVWRRRSALLNWPLLAALALLLFIDSPQGIKPGSFLLGPGDPAHYAERAWLEISPGGAELLAGSPLRIEIRELGLPWRFSGKLALEIDETGDLFRPVELSREGDLWVYEQAAVYQGFSYRADRGRSSSGAFEITVYHAPVLDSLRIHTLPPAYTGLPARDANLRSGELAVPTGSTLRLDGISSAELARAWLVFPGGDTDSLPLAVEGKRLGGSLVVAEDLRMAMGLQDLRGTVTRTPALLALRAVADRAPQVELLSPGPDEDLNRDLRVMLELTASDDYGVASLSIHATQPESGDTLIIPLSVGGGPLPRIAERFAWDLSGFDLFPGDLVEYYVEASDARPDGPGVGRSRVQRLRVPSIAEIYDSIEKEDAGRQDEISELIEEGRQMQEEMRELERELRADPQIDWEQEQELRDALRKQQEMAEKIEDLSKSLKQRGEKLGENEMIREDVAEKLKKIQELVEELRDTEAGEILRRFQEMVEQMNPQSMPEELRQLQMDQEQLLEQLARTEAMLEEIMREQRMDALLEQVDELLEQQEQLRAETEEEAPRLESEPSEEKPGEQADGTEQEQADGDESEQPEGQESEELAEAGQDPQEKDGKTEKELAERQKDLADAAEELAEKIREEAESLKEEFPEESESMAESVEPESDPSQPMSDAAEKMEGGQQGATEDQQDASKKLLKLYWRLMQAQSGMSQSSAQAETEALGQVTRQTLEMSLREEDHQTRMQRQLGQGQNLEAQRASARRQMSLYQSMARIREELLEIAKTSFSVSRNAMRESQEALFAMETSIAELESGRRRQGLSAAGEAVGHINVTVIELLEGIQAQGQGGSGSCNNPMQSMQEMMKRQEQLNRDSQKPGGGMGGGLSMEERSRMQRLQAEQRAIREGVEDLMSGEDELLGRLDKIVEDMKEVEKDFEGGRVTPETLERQEKIFERMLDAQRSVHQREYKQRRKSTSGDDLEPLWPGDEVDDPLEKLREEIRRGLGEAAPPEYEGLIQEYYRSLLERNREVLP